MSGNFSVSTATLKILSISRDGKVKIKVISNEKADGIVKAISNSSFTLTVPSKNDQKVPYKVEFRDTMALTFTISLKFADPKKISNTVELDRLQLYVNEDIESKNGYVMVYVPHKMTTDAKIPPQVSSGAA